MQLPSRTLSLAALPLLTSAAWLASGLGFHPEDGSSLQKQFELEVSVVMDDFSVSVNGQDVSEMIELDEEFEGAIRIGATIDDTYEKVGGGRPLALVRLYEELVFGYEGGGSSDTRHQDDVEGVSVRFTWDEDAERYEREFVDDEGDDAVIEALDEDMDLRALLPADADVEEGDSWEVDGERVLGVLLPGTDPLTLLSAAELPSEASGFATLLAEGLGSIGDDLTLTCTYAGTREIDGVVAAVITVEMEGGVAIDLQSAMNDIDVMGVQPEVEMADLNLQLEGEGELLWNLAGGHLIAFDLASDLELEFDASFSADVEGNTFSAEGQVWFSGEANWTVSAE